MQCVSRFLLIVAICGCFCSRMAAQCPPRPSTGTVVQDATVLNSQNGTLNADFNLGYSVDPFGYTHYCYKYSSSTGVVEAPTLELNPGDELLLNVKDTVPTGSDSMSGMDMSAPAGSTCGDGGTATLQSTNVHFHGMNIPPICHQDDVLTTLIQPGSSAFQYKITVPTTEPPGLYWYHPHVHGFTEFQVNGGAAGALIVEGMDKVRPEVTGLTERVFVVRQQYLVPWVPGPYQLTINYELAGNIQGPAPLIRMQAGAKEFWRVANATLQDFMPLQVWFDGVPQPLEVVALDGYPLAHTRMESTILVPPAGRAEFIVPAPPEGTTVIFVAQSYSTGPTGNFDYEFVLGNIELTKDAPANAAAKPASPSPKVATDNLKFAGLNMATPTATRNLYFSEEFGGTNGPIQFYITVDGQTPKVFEPNEKPVITTKVGAVEDWTIENRALETHAFHIHQIHFMLLE